MSFDISCDLSYHSHKSHHSIYVQVVVEDRCVLKKWVPRIVIGRYGYKSSFGANNGGSNRVNVELEVQHGLYLKGRAVVIIL